MCYVLVEALLVYVSPKYSSLVVLGSVGMTNCFFVFLARNYRVEFATDIKSLYPEKQVTLLHSRHRLLPRFDYEMHTESKFLSLRCRCLSSYAVTC